MSLRSSPDGGLMIVNYVCICLPEHVPIWPVFWKSILLVVKFSQHFEDPVIGMWLVGVTLDGGGKTQQSTDRSVTCVPWPLGVALSPQQGQVSHFRKSLGPVGWPRARIQRGSYAVMEPCSPGPMQLLGPWVGLAPPLACSGAVSARNLSLHDTVDEGRVRVSVNMVRGLPALSLAWLRHWGPSLVDPDCCQ